MNEDDEPPPPYTEVDPLEKKKAEEGARQDRERRLSGHSNSRRSITPGMSGQPHPLFNRTRSDEPAARVASQSSHFGPFGQVGGVDGSGLFVGVAGGTWGR